ncbi:MAG: sulfite exporter TauE/SafE family protein [Nitrospirae bacterium]|nr:sulfite exporter TauE/SafE family protein [Candidatus Manganitrophaceae bacterium]
MIRLFLIALFSLLLSVAEATAHPMGNFSINHYSGLEVGPEGVEVRYLLDFAEIPTFQEIQKIDLDQNGETDPAEQAAYLTEKGGALASGLALTVGGAPLSLTPVSSEIEFSPGAGGLPTMRLSLRYRAPLPPAMTADRRSIALFYRDGNYPGRAGWKEMAAAGRDGISLAGSPLPTQGGELKSYPEKEIQSPPQVVETHFSISLGPTPDSGSTLPRTTPSPGSRFLRNDRFAALMTRLMTGWMTGAAPTAPMLLFALAVSFGLGALHALSPGHGKTIVAAYLVGARGTAKHALLLGSIVTASHTIGVFLLGLVTLYLSKYIVPERLYPWLGLLSGLAIVIIGFSLFRQRWQAMRHDHQDLHHSHHHPHPVDHPHRHDHGHRHDPHPAPTLSGLLGLGITGGIVPCPSALVVLLSAIAFHQVGFGLILIVAFSAGLAATLVAIGLLMVYLGGMMGRLDRFGSLREVLPVLSAAGVTLLGGLIAIGAWIQ